jgi:hypothetical protein
VDRGASGLAETRRDEARRPHRDRVRSAVQGPRDRDAALRRRGEQLFDLLAAQ